MGSGLGIAIAAVFLIGLGGTLWWMLRLPPALPRDVARAVFSVEAARCIVVPILDLLYSERAVEVACRLGQHQRATIVLAYIVEVPRVLPLGASLGPLVDARAEEALAEAQRIVDLHALAAIPITVRARDVVEGVRRTVRNYQADMVVMGMAATEPDISTRFTRAAEALLRRPPCEVVIDHIPA